MVRLALSNPHLVAVLALLIVLIGGTVVLRMPADMLPLFKSPAVQVLTLYPGMPTETMERDITNRLERWTSQANGVSLQESKSLLGVSVVRDYFRPDIDPNTALSQVSALASSDLYYLPPGTIPPMVMPYDPTAALPLALLTVSSDTEDETKLYDVAYFSIRNMLSGISGTIAPAVFGGRIRRIYVYVDPVKLAARGMSALDVAEALRKWNTLIPTGDAKIGALDYFVVANGMAPTVEEINDFPLKVTQGAPVFVKDIGYARDTFQIQTNVVHVNGRRQVYIPIYRQPGANTIEVVDGLKASLPSIKARIPSDVDLNIIFDQSFYVRQSLSSLQKEMLLGAVLAALVVLLFLSSMRYTVVIFLTIPLSVLAAIVGLYATGNTLNGMTLGGLAMAIGPLVDVSIVVLENTVRHLRLGKTAPKAALKAAEEVAGPIAVATIATIIVFFPVVLLTGLGRFLFSPLALAVAFAMIAAYGLAMTLIPTYFAVFVKESVPAAKIEAGLGMRWTTAFSGRFDLLRERYERRLRWVLARQRPTLLAAGIGFAAAVALYPALGTELFPPIDAGQFTVRLRAVSGTRIELSETLAANVESAVRAAIPREEIKTIVTNTGVLYDWPAAYTPNAGPMDSFLNVQLVEGHHHSAQEYVRRLREALPRQFPRVGFDFDTGGLLSAALNNGAPAPIDIQITGNSLRTAHEWAEKVAALARGVRGAVDVRIQQKLDYPSLEVHVDRVKAAYLGLTVETAVKNIVTALNSSTSFSPGFWIDQTNGNHYFLGAQYPEALLSDKAALENIPLTDPSASGETARAPTLLRNIATATEGTSALEVEHRNIQRVTDVYVNVDRRDIGSVAADIEKHIATLKLPAGYNVHMVGEVQSMRESFAGLRFGLLMAVALVYLLLAAQFRSFLDPLTVLIAVPLGIIGVIAALLLTGTTLNIESYIGTIFMVGIAVSNSVVLVEFANRLRTQGATPVEAMVSACSMRLRPILMTALAAIAALSPMAFHFGTGTEANVPLARAVIGGLTASTVLTLFLVPALYLWLTTNRSRGAAGEIS